MDITSQYTLTQLNHASDNNETVFVPNKTI